MYQDLIEIHKLHLIQARTPAVDFSPLDSNNRLELTYINPPSTRLLLSFILHLSYHSSSLLYFYHFIFILQCLFILQCHHITVNAHHHRHPSTLITVIIRQHPSPPPSVNTVIDRYNVKIAARKPESLNWNIGKGEG